MAGISKKRIRTKKGEVTKYVITYRDVFGKQHTAGRYDTLKEAKKHLADFENIKAGDRNITFGEIYSKFLQRAKTKYAQSTYDKYLIYYNKYLKKIENVKYHSVDSIALQGFFDKLEKETTPIVAFECLKISRASFNYAKKHKIISNNIFNDVESISLPKPNINHLTIEESKRILEECKKSYPQYYILLFVFIGTGAREGEIFALTKKDFIRDEKCLLINKQYTQRKLILKTKTESSNRKIYLFDSLANELEKHIASLKSENDLLFPNKTGGYIDAHNFRKRVFYKLLELCGINKRIRLHDLRGSYIDMVLSNGLSCKYAQNQVGHARTETTLNIYARNNADMIKSANYTLDNIFDNSKKCEPNVSQINKHEKSNVIQFPRKSTISR